MADFRIVKCGRPYRLIRVSCASCRRSKRPARCCKATEGQLSQVALHGGRPPCSALEALERQEPFVNQTLAYQTLAMLTQLFRYGLLLCHGGVVNLRTGRASSLPIDPALWQRMRTQSQHFEVSSNRGKKGAQE